MKKQRQSKLFLKRSESSQRQKEQTTQNSINVRKSPHRVSKFVELTNNLDSFNQRKNTIEEPKKNEQQATRFIYGKVQYSCDRVVRHLKLLHQGLIYSTLALGSPSEEYLKQKKLLLPQEPNNKQKLLILDLDETLIHCVEPNQSFDCEVNCQGDKIRFNIRPFCQMFLDVISQHFQVYVFSSATEEQVKSIVDYLNFNKTYIRGFLSRQHCLETRNGLRIKDLRIIKNRDISQIVIVDNLVHSFGLQLQNGIPIMEFTNQKNDRQLLGLQKILLELKKAADVRVYLRQKLGLRKCIQWPEDEFVQVKQNKNFVIKKKTSYF